MTHDELRIYAFESIVGPNASNWVGEDMKKILAHVGGDVEKAIQYCIDSEVHLFQGGSCGPNSPNVYFFCGYRGKGEAWFHENSFKSLPPDLYFDWKELFQWVQGGCPKHIQLELF
jgi:hypothetical protein